MRKRSTYNPEPVDITTKTDRKRAITNSDIAARLDKLEENIGKRLDHLEEAVGLNGDGATLKAFLEQLRAANVNHLAWNGVRADLKARMKFLTQPRRWLGIVFAAILGGAGWAIANHLLAIWPTTGNPVHP